jgi:inosine-uridine nucleoside N-ribohydrolase
MLLVIDTDPGNGIAGADVDDALALALALRSPELEVLAITVVAGNVPVDVGVRAAYEVLDAAGGHSVPVHAGAQQPLVQDPGPWRALLDQRHLDVRAQRLWESIVQPSSVKPPDPLPAAQALVDLVDRHPGEVTVLAIGPLTNLAAAMMLDPTWQHKVARIVWMGGAFELPDVLQELNAAYDPEATHMVLTSEAPMLVVPLDVTMRTHLRLAELERLAQRRTPLTDYITEVVRPWVTWLAERFGRDGCPLHDALALAALLDPGVITTRRRSADIELHGQLTRGRTIAWDAANDELLQTVVPLPPARPVDIAADVDNSAFMPLLLERIGR